MKKLIFFAAILCFYLLSSCDKESNPSSGSTAYNGTWTGATSQGKEIVFRVRNNGIDSVAVIYDRYGTDYEQWSCFEPVEIADKHFSIAATCAGPSLYITMEGTFNTAASSAGTLILSYPGPNPHPVIFTDTLTWTANKGNGNNDEEDDLSGVWTGTCSSSLVDENNLSFIITQNGNSFSGYYGSSTGAEGTISGTKNGNNISFSLTQTTQTCPGYFTGSGILSGTTINFTFTGSDCMGTHENGAGTLSKH